jgi:3',5'-cyclic-AMP phosphodiesterase
MKIIEVREPSSTLTYHCAAPKGQTRERSLPYHEVIVDHLPDGMDTLIVTADLQGREKKAPHRLLGEVVAEELREEIDPTRSGVLLAGDLYANEGADKLGSSGEVGSVWKAFAKHYRWTVGVLGNHDRLKDSVENTALLDGQILEKDGLRIGGISGIIGKASRLLRRDLESYLELLEEILSSNPDVVVLHESPANDLPERRGNPHIAALLARSNPVLVTCGHCYWPSPLIELKNGTQILNVDSRLCLLRARGFYTEES